MRYTNQHFTYLFTFTNGGGGGGLGGVGGGVVVVGGGGSGRGGGSSILGNCKAINSTRSVYSWHSVMKVSSSANHNITGNLASLDLIDLFAVLTWFHSRSPATSSDRGNSPL